MKVDIVIVGAGIIGLSTAYQLSKKHPDKDIAVVDKEAEVAKHQTGHNSGVIHSGIYYKPGSYKARFARNGSKSMVEFCEKHQIEYNQCGKVIVATSESQLANMNKLYERGIENGLDVERLSRDEVKEIEPFVNTVGGIHVKNTGIVDFKKVTEKYAELFIENGGMLRLHNEVKDIQMETEKITVVTNETTYEADYLINCAGLYSDKLARMARIETDVQIIPFRGEYFELDERIEHYVKTLIYPVPNPDLPFLGVHFTNMIGGGVDVGPNAVLGFKKEAYQKIGFNLKETTQIITFPGLYRMGIKNMKEAIGEYYRSFSKKAFVKEAQKLIPSLTAADIKPMEAGVRAQAMKPDGTMLDDFYFEENASSLHVLNAPSPAATCSIEIGKEIAKRFNQKMPAVT
ncbi:MULTISPECIES: L-2-hydroxyglutarate oxidase [Oceanobacillus]|uniref:L-2-hydroxyglutarate oxidase n=2 Tax=Oceanobacillus TaxID=182709 RepID=A0ABV9JTP6_9BACI|nr:L-2-hydroxyglutarate oxidase [Oceanobacillus oncorhynchi]MDM8102180.1 L-2-hydroxyglutarate oxidase [Oceanobacillus oncorhynchi]UUI40260.1 L-2-hydroxyglutarate oxidase [Oceanobacillus oncorhynchi]